MEYRSLGLAGARVSAIGLGGNTFGRYADAARTEAIVKTALDLGVNHIDTAESYSNGVSEEYLGRALKGRRGEATLATKTGALGEPEGRLSRQRIVARLDASLRRLGTDYVDLYYLHFPDPSTPIEESLRALDDSVRAGKVLYPAISNHAAWAVADALGITTRAGYAAPVVTQNPYSLLDRRVEGELVPACLHFGVGMIPYSPLAGGFLTGKYRRGEEPPPGVRGHANERWQQTWLQDANFTSLDRLSAFASERGRTVAELAIAWLVAQPVVSSVIIGATSPDQVERNVRAADWRLTPDEIAEL